MRLRSLNRWACTLLFLGMIAFLVPSPASAENRKHSIELGGLWTFLRFDPSAELESDFAPTLQFGFHFTKRHGGEISLSATTTTPDTGGFAVDMDVVRVGYTFNAYPRERFVSFFRAGAGLMTLHPESNTSSSDRLDSPQHNPLIYGGAGLRIFFNDSVAFRIDGTIDWIDAQDGFVHADVQGTAGIGVTFVVGGTSDSSEAAN